MKTIILIFLTLICCIQHTWGQQFRFETFSLGTFTLPYRKAEINIDNISHPSLVLYLHGGGSRGIDNEKQLSEKAVQIILNYLSEKGTPTIFIIPQCPMEEGWTNHNHKIIHELLKSCLQTHDADINRIYIMGGSMGGTGTWCQLSNYPNFYAAAMPVAGNPSGMNAEFIASTPTLTVMGTADKLMDISIVETLQKQVTNLGGTLLLETEKEWTHSYTCENSYTTERLDWIFSHTRNPLNNIIPQKMSFKKSTKGIYNLNGQQTNYHIRGIYIENGIKRFY